MAQAERSSVTIQSVERAATTLQVFFEAGSSLSFTEVVAATGLAPATLHRLLATLLKTGWISQDARGSRYELSEQMLGNAALAIASSPLLHHGHHYLTQLSDRTGLNSFLAVPIRRGSVMLARAQGRDAPSGEFQTGKTLPLHSSASGKIFLAFAPEAERQSLLRGLGELKKITRNTIVDREQLLEVLDEVRQRGYAFDHGELSETYQSVAVPVRKADGRVVAALCLGGWSTSANQDIEKYLLSEIVPAGQEFSRVYGQFDPW